MSHAEVPAREIGRELRTIDRANRAAMPRWRELLERVFSGDIRTTRRERAALVGVPDPGRRQAFRIGGLGLAGAALLAACGDDDDSDAAEEPGDTGTGTGAPGGDVSLAKTAASLEQLAIDTYTAAAGSGLVANQAILDAATLFAQHHTEHRDALNGVITGAGQEAVTAANAFAFENLVKPRLDAAASEADLVQLALDLESTAAQTYVFAGGQLSTPALRSTIMTIGGIEARHAAVLVMAAQGRPPTDVFPESRGFYPADNPLPAEAILT